MRCTAVLVLALLLAAPAAAQTPARVDSTQVDSLLADLVDGRKDAVSSRGFIRASETQLTKIIDRLDALIARVRALLGSPPDTIVVPPDTVIPDPPEPEPPAPWATDRKSTR